MTASHAPILGGLTSPDGVTQALPLPVDMAWPKNVDSRGMGCCAFRALGYAARWQNVAALIDMPEKMIKDEIPGGGWPEKVDKLLRRYDPAATYWNDSSGNLNILAAALASKRMPCIAYNGHDPHYHGGVAHCVNVIAFDQPSGWVAILDNNYPKLDQIVWMGTEEFCQRWQGWSYGLLAQTPGSLPATATADTDAPASAAVAGAVFGLVRTRPLRLEAVVMNGSPSSTDAIIAAMGGEFVPKVEVDHKIGTAIDLKGFSDAALPIVLVIFGMFLLKEMLKGGDK